MNKKVKINNLNPKEWREYEKDGFKFFSIWDTPERDILKWTSKTIRGNSPVEIPKQCILRFSKEGETVLDTFVGSGTTLIVCARLKRNGIGIEINPNIIEIAKSNLSMDSFDIEINKWLKKQKLIIGDSRNLEVLGIKNKSVDLVFIHPPYWKLINYNNEYGLAKNDLSTILTLEEYLYKMTEGFKEIFRVLKNGKYFCVLIGDCFLKGGKVIPLDYYLTDLALKIGFEFYAKNIKYTRFAKSRMNCMNIMKYRSLRSNFFICIHDYILIFKKPL